MNTLFEEKMVIDGLGESQPCYNKTGLQPVSRPVELVHYFGGWVEGPSKQTDRQD